MKKNYIILCVLFLVCLTGCSSKTPKAPDGFGTGVSKI